MCILYILLPECSVVYTASIIVLKGSQLHCKCSCIIGKHSRKHVNVHSICNPSLRVMIMQLNHLHGHLIGMQTTFSFTIIYIYTSHTNTLQRLQSSVLEKQTIQEWSNAHVH